MAQSLQKISDIYSAGKIWKPVRFQVIFNYQPIPTRDGKNTVWKSIIADETGCTTLIYLEDKTNASFDRNRALKVNHRYVITAGGGSARSSKTEYKSLVSHRHEIWISHPDKIAPYKDNFDIIKTPLNVELTRLNMLALDDKRYDILARVFWKGPEQESENGFKFKEIKLEDDTLKGDKNSILCKLVGDHRKLVSKKGIILLIANCSVNKTSGNDLMIYVGDTSAVIEITADNDWLLPPNQQSFKNELIVKRTGRSRASNDNSSDNSNNGDSFNGFPAPLTPNNNDERDRKKMKLELKESSSTNQSCQNTRHNTSPNKNNSPRKDKMENAANIAEMQKILNGRKPGPLKFELTNVKLTNYYFRRYLGCAECSKSVYITDGKYICYGMKCQGKDNDRSGPGQRKAFYLLKNIALSDESDSISDLLAYNNPLEELLDKSADDFATDSEAFDAIRSCLPKEKMMTVIITAKRGGTRGPNLAAQWGFVIDKFTLQESSDIALPDVSDASQYESSRNEQKSETIISELASRLANPNLLLDIQVLKNAQKTSNGVVESEDDVYPMRSMPRGLAIHINIAAIMTENPQTHEIRTTPRRGAEADSMMFERLFQQLNYRVVTLLNVKSTEIAGKINECRSMLVSENCDSLVLCISSHGLNNNFLFADGVIKNIWTDILYQFNDTNFLEFRGKPKVVLINTCQDFHELPIPCTAPPLAANHPDFLVFVSNSPGYKSFRNPEIGTHFIRTTAMVLSRCAHNTEIRDMFRMVQAIMKCPEFEPMIPREPQIPEIREFLFMKSFYFRPESFLADLKQIKSKSAWFKNPFLNYLMDMLSNWWRSRIFNGFR